MLNWASVGWPFRPVLAAVGTLWYVDDAVTSAYFVQMYRASGRAFPKPKRCN